MGDSLCIWTQECNRVRCVNCKTVRRFAVNRRCKSRDTANLLSIQANGLERTDNEVLVIITTYCTSCPAWNPKAEKKKCKYCGCGSSDTVENLHKRRIRNCPKGHWTEDSLQAYLHPENTSSTDYKKSP